MQAVCDRIDFIEQRQAERCVEGAELRVISNGLQSGMILGIPTQDFAFGR